MIFLISSFFIIAPILILYTSGFRYSLVTGELKTTGVISIDAEPQDATVYINNKNVGNKQPLRLDGLAPGIYDVRISKAGYHDFNTLITLHSQETSYVKGITLWKKNNPVQREKIPLDLIKEVGINPSTPQNYFFTTRDTATTSLQIDLNTESLPQTSIFSFPTPKNSLISCAATKNHCTWWSSKDKKLNFVSLDDINNKLSFTATEPTWQWSDNPKILGFLENKNTIQAVNLDYTLNTIDHNSSKIWFVDSQSGFWSATNTQVETTPKNGKKITITLGNPVIQIIDANQNFALIKMSENIDIITDLNTNLTRNTIRANNFYHHQSAQNWLLWSPSEITGVSDESGQHGIIYRSGEPITAVLGLEATGSILIIQPKKIFAFNPGYFTTQELADFDSIKAIATDETSRTIVIAGSKNNEPGIYTLAY